MNDPRDISELIRLSNEIRKRRGITQADMAEEMGISLRTLEEWLQERRYPKGPGHRLLSSWVERHNVDVTNRNDLKDRLNATSTFLGRYGYYPELVLFVSEDRRILDNVKHSLSLEFSGHEPRGSVLQVLNVNVYSYLPPITKFRVDEGRGYDVEHLNITCPHYQVALRDNPDPRKPYNLVFIDLTRTTRKLNDLTCVLNFLAGLPHKPITIGVFSDYNIPFNGPTINY